MTKELIKYLESFITERRLDLFNRILDKRTNYITVLLEDIYQPQNASAVMRSCDCFGVQSIHVVENRNEYQLNPDVTLGSDKWINLHKYNQKQDNTTIAIQSLRKQGYQIVATTPHSKDVSLEEFNINKGKFALLFGTELHGLSKTALDLSDTFLRIPMVGFTESLNISVSAAIILQYLTTKIRNSDVPWQLNEYDRDITKLNWLRKTIKECGLIEKEFLTKQINSQNLTN